MIQDEDPRPKINAYLMIGGRDEFDPEECTRAFGARPTKIWRQKHEHLLSHPELHHAVWMLGFEDMRTQDLDDAMQAFLEMIWPLRDKVSEYLRASGRQASIECAIRAESLGVVYRLSPSTLRRLGELGIEVGFDIYDFT